jgi:UDP-glucuronate 4-epimerase
MERILVTGAAGFIGFHTANYLLKRGDYVVGIDNMNDYYEVSLKETRRDILLNERNFSFQILDIEDKNGLDKLFDKEKFDSVIHLAAQAGVRYSITNPDVYIRSNLVGFANMLECCRNNTINHFTFASSSSVYGANTEIPFSTDQKTDRQVSLYGATKKANELLAYSYAHLYGLPSTGLRFFTVYGPWGRPDMAIFSFTKAILANKPIDVYNHGRMRRDFTYIDDIVEGVVRVNDNPPGPKHPDSYFGEIPFRVYNIGNHKPVELEVLIETLEKHLGKKSIRNMKEMQPGDVLETYADTNDLQKYFGFKPNTPLDAGIEQFVKWYKQFYP